MSLHYVQGESVFLKTQKVDQQYPYLTKNCETDLLIIGGGVTGSIVGYYMTSVGIPTVMIEAKRVAHGSTSITTALLQYELDGTARELEPYTSLENTRTVYKLTLEALDDIKEFVEEYGNHCQHQIRDTLLYTNKHQEVTAMKEEYDIRKKAGLEVSYLSEADHSFGFELKAGVYGHRAGAELNPYLYTHQLLDVATKQGLQVYENTEAIELMYTHEGVEVTTSYGYVVKAKKVIVATGYNTKLFTPRQFGSKTVTYNIATKPVKIFEGWENRVLIRDNQNPYHYFRTTPEGRIIVGGEDVDFVQNINKEEVAKEKYQKLLAHIRMMFPDIPDLEIEYSYCGAFASTKDNLGFVGPDSKHQNVWYCLGYGANGILFAILGAKMLSKLIKGEEDKNMKLFKVDRFDGI